VAIGKAKFNRQVASFDVAGLLEALAKCSENSFLRVGVGLSETEPTDGACRSLLRSR
jgi:hypothetical protein